MLIVSQAMMQMALPGKACMQQRGVHSMASLQCGAVGASMNHAPFSSALRPERRASTLASSSSASRIQAASNTCQRQRAVRSTGAANMLGTGGEKNLARACISSRILRASRLPPSVTTSASGRDGLIHLSERLLLVRTCILIRRTAQSAQAGAHCQLADDFCLIECRTG